MLVLDDACPSDPQDITTLDGFASVNDDASHFTHDETLNGEEPVGNDDKSKVDKYDPPEKTRAREGKLEEL